MLRDIFIFKWIEIPYILFNILFHDVSGWKLRPTNKIENISKGCQVKPHNWPVLNQWLYNFFTHFCVPLCFSRLHGAWSQSRPSPQWYKYRRWIWFQYKVIMRRSRLFRECGMGSLVILLWDFNELKFSRGDPNPQPPSWSAHSHGHTGVSYISPRVNKTNDSFCFSFDLS